MSGYAPGAAAGVAGEPPAQVGQIRFSGIWKDPPDWQGRWMWDGVVTEFSGARGQPEVPNLYFITTQYEYRKRLTSVYEGGSGWKDASELPVELREAILDYYGPNLTETMREICAEQIAARAARKSARPMKATKAKAKPKAACRRRRTKR